MEKIRKRIGISGAVLKWIAVVSMFIDHTAYMLYWGVYRAIYPRTETVYRLYRVGRDLGRAAFPIYCFLLVEGFCHTRDLKKYMGRLLLFGLISELPFDLLFQNKRVDLSYQNVYFTLLLGLMAVWCFHRLTAGKKGWSLLWRIPLGLLIGAGLAWAAEKAHVDYGWTGVAVILAMFVFRRHQILRFISAGGLALTSSLSEAFSWPDFLLFAFYNGERGRQPKYFFYVFYPAHLTVLILIREILLRIYR